jgi:uncharacterized protein
VADDPPGGDGKRLQSYGIIGTGLLAGGDRMKALIRLALFTLCPVLSSAEVAGTWEGALKFPAQTLRIVLHISGDDNDLKATNDSPDQGNWGGKVDTITLSGHVLTFAIRRIEVRFTGTLMSDGSIVGTFTQHGAGFPLAGC